MTGGPAISNDEMATAFDDSKVATLLAFAFTLGSSSSASGASSSRCCMLATLAVSLAWSMGIITLVVGHLSIFSVMFISIVVGIGIDYGIYFLYRYQEELALAAVAGRRPPPDGRAGGPGHAARRRSPRPARSSC